MQIRSGSEQKSESKTNSSRQEAPSPFSDFFLKLFILYWSVAN